MAYYKMNARDLEGNTRLHLAVINGDIDSLRGLYNANVDITLRNDYGKYAFQYALDKNFYDAIPYTMNETLLNTLDDKGRYPMYYVSKCREMLHVMINMGARLDLPDSQGKTSLWHIYNTMDIYDVDILESHAMIIENTDVKALFDVSPVIRRIAYIKSRMEVRV